MHGNFLQIHIIIVILFAEKEKGNIKEFAKTNIEVAHKKRRGYTNAMKNIILASASPRRRELLEKLRIPFEIRVSDVKEIITKTVPAEIVEELSLQKAMAVAETEPDALVIGADTMVASDETVLGKPKDKEDAAAMLKSLQGKSHQVYTGVTLTWMGEKEREIRTFSEASQVFLYPMTEEEIQRYVDTGEPMDKAGGYAIQGLFAVYVKGIAGDYNNIVGLPVARLYQELKKNGIVIVPANE